MKTKRRHELQTNKLADWLGIQIEALKPYSNHIVAGVVGVVVILAFLIYMSSSQKDRTSAAWSAYFAAVAEQSPDALTSVPKNHPNTVAALWALQSAGDIQIREGTRLLYTEREEGIKSLEAAQQNFERVANDSKTPAMLKSRSQYALAQTLETLGKLDEAKQWYTKIPADTAIGAMAAEDLRRLADAETADFYGTLASYKPRDMDSSFEPEDPLKDFPDVPKRPDLSFPGDDDFLTSDSGESGPGDSGESGPGDSGESGPGDSGKSDADKPGVGDNSFDTTTDNTKKPDGETKPGGEKPDAEKKSDADSSTKDDKKKPAENSPGASTNDANKKPDSKE